MHFVSNNSRNKNKIYFVGTKNVHWRKVQQRAFTCLESVLTPQWRINFIQKLNQLLIFENC